ncbi:hypothetical protein JCM8547_000115 [Rhodosporidiobolus lusitaniae]
MITTPIYTLESYPPTPSFSPTPRFLAALSSFSQMHSTDPAGASQAYHSTLEAYTRKLSSLSSDPRIQEGPSEALLLAANCQHVRRWEKPRSEYPEGLSSYKMWRTALNKFHADIAESVMTSSGYDPSVPEDAELIKRVRELLLKKTLNKAPLPRPEELKDPEAHLFEDSICLVFLALEFVKFAAPYLPSAQSTSPSSSPHITPDKLQGIIARTWAKMTPLGRGVVVEELVGGLPEELKGVVLESVSGVKDAYEQ